MMDRIRQRAQSLLEKLHDKYGIEPKHPIHLVLTAAVCKKEGDDPGLHDHWYLVDTHGQKFRLPKTMLFLGREECDVVVASQSVDKRHAVLTFDLYLNRFKVKDLSTTNGTYVNNSRISEQEYVTLNHMDSVRLGHDAMMYHVEQGSQITGQGGQLPDPSFVPAWASRQHHHHHQQQHPGQGQGEPIHVHAHAMAECQLHYIGLYGWFPTLGCIAEQNIEHSCSLKHEPGLHEDHVRVSCTPSPSLSSTSSQHHHHHHHQHQHHSHHPKQQTSPPLASPSSSSSSLLASHRNRSPQSSSSSSLSNPEPCQPHPDDHHHHHTHHSRPLNSEGTDDSQHSNAQKTQQVAAGSPPPTQKSSSPRDRPPPSPGSSKDSGHPRRQRHRDQQEKHVGDANSALTAVTSEGGSVTTSTWGEEYELDDGSEGSTITPPGAPATTANTGPGRNTWPRKRARPGIPHVSDLFPPQDGGGDGSEARPAVTAGGMYFVAFDDSICNGAGSVNDAVKRRPRNSQNPLPPELTTVKRGTPLYGQPSWWGEEEDDEVDENKEEVSTAPRTSNTVGPAGDRQLRTRDDGSGAGGGGGGTTSSPQTRGSKRSRPNSLVLSGDEADLHQPPSSSGGKATSTAGKPSGPEARGGSGHARMNGERIKPTYMEIPLRDDDDGNGGGKSQRKEDTTSASGVSGKKATTSGTANNASGSSTPSKSVSSSLSRDSLIMDSPDARKPPAATSAKASGETATSFTVDFIDPSDPAHKPAKAVTMTASLSQYVPSKIRRNFKDRQDRAGSHAKAGSSSRGSTPSKTSEERELSPAHQASSQSQQQRKLEEIWSVVETGGKPAKQAARLSSVQATAGSISSLRSPNLEEIDRLSGEDKARGQKQSSLSPHVLRSARAKPSSSTSSLNAVGGTAKGAGVVAAVAQYPDSTAYLIDRMLEGGGSARGSEASSAPSSTADSQSEAAPEKQMYKEAAAHDRARTRRSTSSSAASGGKPAVRGAKTSATTATGKPGTSAPAKRNPALPAGKAARTTSSSSSSAAKKNILSSSSPRTTTAAKVSSHDKRASAGAVPPSPPKVCDIANDDSDDDDHDIVDDCGVNDDDLQITEDEAPSSLALEDGEVSDKASEAGTYVIEAGGDGEGDDGEAEEEEEARRKIDEVFGVDKPHIDPLRLASPGGYDNVYDDDEDGDDDDDNDETFGANEGDQTPLEGHSPLDEEDGVMEPAMSSTDGVQTWMSQLSALTAGHRQPALSADDRQMARDDGEASLSRKPPQAGGGKRPGTGRKLPSIPTTDRSPVSSEHSSSCPLEPDLAVVPDGQAGWSAASSQQRVTAINGGLKTNGSVRGKTVADAPSGHSSKNHKTGGSGAVRNGVSNGTHARNASSSSPGSARSRGSVDTELLLQDTETVMAAMEARMAHRGVAPDRRRGGGSREDEECDSDTDVSSTVALVNGDEDYVKPSYYTSPRDALSWSNSDAKIAKAGGHTSNTVASSSASAQAGKRPAGRSYSQMVAAAKSRTPSSSANASPRTPTSSSTISAHRRSVGSDIAYNGRDSVGADSLASDLGSESGCGTTVADTSGSLSRSSSRGKGTITMTKPNRAFQLRRARSDSVEDAGVTPTTTPRSAKSGATGTSRTHGGSSARSSSVHSTGRTRSGVDTNRSEATSLGAQIARKSRSNGATMQPDSRTSSNSGGAGGVGAGAAKASSSSNLYRQDGGRHSLRLTRASSLTISSPGQGKKDLPHTAASGASSSNNHSKPHARTTPTNNTRGSLAITGVGTSGGATSGSTRSHSQPGSRSNSPKAAERIAWRRRKEYDPRRAVAEAKAAAKAKDSGGGSGSGGVGHHAPVTLRAKPHAGAARANRRMIRSASFTNTGGSLGLSLASSVSASQELVSGPPADHNSSVEGAFRRAFLPFQAVAGRLGGHHAAHSADEDDSSPGSTRTSYDTLIVSSIYQLSMKLVSNTDKSLLKLRDQSRASHSPSPCDDFLSSGGRTEMTAFRSANQELAGVLNNLRRLERHVQVMNSVLFPEDEVPTRLSAGSLPSPSTPSSTSGIPSTSSGRQGKQRYFAEIERIRSELAGFHPIGGGQAATVPDNVSNETDSPEMAELSEQF